MMDDSLNNQEWGYNRSDRSGRTTKQSDGKKTAKVRNRAKINNIRCSICNKLFQPSRFDQKVCSDECRRRLHSIKDRDRYQMKVGAKNKGIKKSSSLDKKCQKLTHKGQLKQMFASAKEALASLTKEEVASVEAIMNLPYEQRWMAGARDWTEAQRTLAKKIELRRIAFETKELEEEDTIRNRLYQIAQTDQKEINGMEDDEVDGE